MELALGMDMCAVTTQAIVSPAATTPIVGETGVTIVDENGNTIVAE